MSTTISTITSLKAFINKIKIDEIMNLLLRLEELEIDKNHLSDKFLEFEDEDMFFFEEDILADKFINLENEIDKFSVSARGRDWRRILEEDRDAIIIGDEKILTPQELVHGDVSSRYTLDNRSIYKIHFSLFRFSEEDKPILTFYLERALS